MIGPSRHVANAFDAVVDRWWRCAGATLVARLDVFGSAARQADGADDLDLLVEIEALPACCLHAAVLRSAIIDLMSSFGLIVTPVPFAYSVFSFLSPSTM
jgi:predicted nucleotidyltransferase